MLFQESMLLLFFQYFKINESDKLFHFVQGLFSLCNHYILAEAAFIAEGSIVLRYK